MSRANKILDISSPEILCYSTAGIKITEDILNEKLSKFLISLKRHITPNIPLEHRVEFLNIQNDTGVEFKKPVHIVVYSGDSDYVLGTMSGEFSKDSVSAQFSNLTGIFSEKMNARKTKKMIKQLTAVAKSSLKKLASDIDKKKVSNG